MTHQKIQLVGLLEVAFQGSQMRKRRQRRQRKEKRTGKERLLKELEIPPKKLKFGGGKTICNQQSVEQMRPTSRQKIAGIAMLHPIELP